MFLQQAVSTVAEQEADAEGEEHENEGGVGIPQHTQGLAALNWTPVVLPAARSARKSHHEARIDSAWSRRF